MGAKNLLKTLHISDDFMWILILNHYILNQVQEEVEHGLGLATRTVGSSSSLSTIQGSESSCLKLSLSARLSLPMYTASKIVDLEGNPLQIILLETRGDRTIQTSLPYPVKVEIVVLDGDFPQGDGETWTSEEFEVNIVRARTGKRPLLTGESHVTMRNGTVPLGEVEFTDNSSWVRSRKFRLGARVVQRSGGEMKIQEAISEAFTVRDHRGECKFIFFLNYSLKNNMCFVFYLNYVLYVICKSTNCEHAFPMFLMLFFASV